MRGLSSIGFATLLVACAGGPEPQARTAADSSEFSPQSRPAIVPPASEATGSNGVEGPKPKPAIEEPPAFTVTRSLDVELFPGHARIKLRLDAVAGPGASSVWSTRLGDEDSLPPGGVATGFRVLARTPEGNGWREGALVDPLKARAVFAAQPGADAGVPAGLLEFVGRGMWGLHLGPCTVASPCSAEVQFVVPTYFEEGQHRLTLGAVPEARSAVQLRVRPGNSRDGLLLDGKPVARDAPLVVADKELTVALARSERRALEGELLSHRVGPKRFLTRWRYETPTRLSVVPRGVHSVVVIDASRSLTSSDLQSQVTAAQAYIDQVAGVPGARVAVLRFDRKTSAVTPGFVTPVEALAALEKMPGSLANGSHVDLALAEAKRLLAQVPRATARRVVLFTDTLTRKALGARRLAPALARSGALTHVISVSGAADPGGTDREDKHPWASSVRRTGGLVWSATVLSRGEAQPAAKRWLRPTQLDDVRVTGLPSGWEGPDAVMVEGESRSSFSITPAPVSGLAVRGELWSKVVRLNLRSNPKLAPLWAALALSDLGLDVEDGELRMLAKLGHAVSIHTSLFVALPGERKLPEREGYGGSTACCAPPPHGGHGRWAVGRVKQTVFDARGHLTRALTPALESCKVSKGQVTVTVETSYSEVVDVAVRLKKLDTAQADCLMEAAWRLTLPAEFRRRSAASYPVQL